MINEYDQAEQQAIARLEQRLAALFLEDPFWHRHPEATAIAVASTLANVLRVIVTVDGAARLPWIKELLGQIADTVAQDLRPPATVPAGAEPLKWH